MQEIDWGNVIANLDRLTDEMLLEISRKCRRIMYERAIAEFRKNHTDKEPMTK